MKDISTHDHVQRLAICIERRVRAECIVRIQPSGPHAASVKARQREERAALKALNLHLKECVKEHERQVSDFLLRGKARGEALYRPTRRGLKKIK